MTAGGADIALSVRDLGVRFGGLRALSGVSLNVREGEVHGLLGPNGSGKTTLLNAASGFVRCTGAIDMFGVSLLGHPAHRRASLGLLRTFQNPKLVRELTVGDLLRMGEHVRGMRPWWQVALAPVADRRARLQGQDRALAALGLLELDAELLTAQVSELSQGVLKMVDIARALMAEPRVLLLDEPSSGMSEEEIVHLRGRLSALVARGTTLVLVEHNLNLVRSVCDTVTVLNLGQRICTGPTAEVLARPDVAEAFLGTAGATSAG
jgi:ABC-type branched-subunit amino acid transport system ATPase component